MICGRCKNDTAKEITLFHSTVVWCPCEEGQKQVEAPKRQLYSLMEIYNAAVKAKGGDRDAIYPLTIRSGNGKEFVVRTKMEWAHRIDKGKKTSKGIHPGWELVTK